MKNFEFVTASSNDLLVALKNLKQGIIEQLGNKNYTINNVFVSQQVMSHVASPNGILVFHVTALVIDHDNEAAISNEDAIANAVKVKNIFNQEF